MTPLDEKRKTAQNTKSEIVDARVIANYGDPGLDEDYHFDLLSRYVIVVIESAYRVLTKDKWFKMLAVVQRPQHLWIATDGGVTGNPTTQRRLDATGNVNVGLAASPSTKGIQRMNQPYAIGEQIKIRRLPTNYTQANFTAFFSSDFHQDSTNYGSWHSQGSSLAYIANDQNKINALQSSTIKLVPNSTAGLFDMRLNASQYEAFMLSICDPAYEGNITKIFDGSWAQGTPVYSANGGYLFSQMSEVLFSACGYEDINVGNKVRIGANDCLPLVVATPNAFPTPKVRAAGGIAYTPSYSPIAR